VRKQIVGAILATDMAMHFTKNELIKGKLNTPDFNPAEEKQKICEYLFHCCDISNSAKPFNLCEKWTSLLFSEFFHQGDQERLQGVPIS